MFEFWQDYTNLVWPNKYNWVNFTFIHFYIEWDKFDNSIVIELGLLGLNTRISIPLPGSTEQSEQLLKTIKEAEAEYPEIVKKRTK